MALNLSLTQQKITEKLIILNDRCVGILTRIYNIKKACGDSKSKPSFLSDKSLEPCIKQIIRKFPNTDAKTVSQAHHQTLTNVRLEIMKSLSLYYYTFVDLLDLKDNTYELLTVMDALQLQSAMDIGVSFELTKNYLDLVTNYVCLMILLSRVDDRKPVLGLFNIAHDLVNNQGDPSFPRLGQMIMDYENPLKKLHEEFVPHSKLVSAAVASLMPLYHRRNLTAEQWRANQMLSLISNPNQLLNPALTDVMPCEYLSLDTLERWLILGMVLAPQQLSQHQPRDMFIQSLNTGWCITLFRDEVLYHHSAIQSFFESRKELSKRVSEVKECYTHSVQHSALLHRERRKFLRSALKELCLILTDQPGLLGPKALFVLMALTFARDEVLWLLRHHDNLPTTKVKGSSKAEDLVDRHLPELLFHMEELRALVKKYSQVLQRYYVQYLSGYDTIALNSLLQKLPNLPEEEAVILTAMCTDLGQLNVKQVEEGCPFDFRGLRLDWFRLQVYCSGGNTTDTGGINLRDHREMATLLNQVVFHTKMVDYLDEILLETSDLSIFCFFSKQFEDNFHMCLEFPAQNRYIIAFPLICSHMQSCTHEVCPEERYHIRERSLSVVNLFLEEMAKEAKNIITIICDEQCTLADKLLPKHSVRQIFNHKKKEKKKKKDESEEARPGHESYRRSREDLTTMDKLHMALTELCFAINYCGQVQVWEYTFAPREYLYQNLEQRFAKALVGMVMYNPETNEIAKPSELLVCVRTYMTVLQSVENYVHIDITRVFNNVLLQQTQLQDSHGEKTITALYNNWYCDILLRRVSAGHIVFSKTQRAFVSLTQEGALPFAAEEFSDVNEMRALAELIGPYGMRALNENLMWHIVNQVTELKKLVVLNKDVLLSMRTNFDKPDQMKDLFRKLQNVDSVLSRMQIIGVILCFRQLSREALNDVLEARIPFLISSIADFKHHVPNGDNMLVAEMSSAAGFPCDVDPALVNVLRSQKSESMDEEFVLTCLLMVFVAVSIPRLSRHENTVYKPLYSAHANNSHCLAQAVNTLFAALFTFCGRAQDIEERLKEFLALASSSLLRLGKENDKEAVKNRDATYILLHQIVEESPFLTMDLLEACFPYALIRNAYHGVHRAGGRE